MEGFIDPILVNRFYNAVTNATSLRSQSGSSSFDRRRDIPVECGFPENTELTPERIKDWYRRDALAARVIEVWPRECWKVQPDIFESEDAKVNTPFEISYQQLGRSLISEPGYYEETDSNSVLEYLLRADIMSGIGRYGVILLGTNDGKDLSQPLEMKPSSSGGSYRLNFIRVFDESLARISAREMDKTNIRFGQPTSYQITFDNPDELGSLGMVGSQLSSDVHWTRCIHVVDNIQSNEIMGQYRVEPVANDLLTAQKSRWGSGEMFWNGASPKLSFETHPQLGGDVIINKSRMKDEIEKALRGLQQWWVISGLTTKTIAPVAVDPKPFTDICIQSICIKLGVPLPIFIGYEVGENAGTMNTEEWNNRLRERQRRQITPRIICPFLNRLINLGILALPTLGYKVKWPEVTSNTAKDKAQLQNLKINMVVAYLKNGLGQLIPPVEFMVRFLEMTEEEALVILNKAREELSKQQTVSTLPQQPANPTQQPNEQQQQTPQQPSANPNTQPQTQATSIPSV